MLKFLLFFHHLLNYKFDVKLHQDGNSLYVDTDFGYQSVMDLQSGSISGHWTFTFDAPGSWEFRVMVCTCSACNIVTRYDDFEYRSSASTLQQWQLTFHPSALVPFEFNHCLHTVAAISPSARRIPR